MHVAAASVPTAMAVLDEIDACFDALASLALAPTNIHEANELIRRTERVGRRGDAARARTLAMIDDGAWYAVDGHRRAEILVGHVGHLSEQEAKRRARARRALRDMPAVAAAFQAGTIGLDQVNRIAGVHASSTVGKRFTKLDAQVALLAARLSYEELDRRLTNWVRAVDEDGTADKARRCHQNRRARMTQEYEGGWELLAGFGSVDGAMNHAILRAFTDAEFAKDWAEAKAEFGDQTTVEHLARTHDQRTADALTRIFTLAADYSANAEGGSRIDLNVVVDQETLERHLLRNAGVDLPPRPEPDLGPLPDETEPEPADPPVKERPRCETLDGAPIDPSEVAASALISRLRRVVYEARGVVIDLSEIGTLFTGSARLAAQLERSTCYWPGCTQPVSRCQIDHLQPRRDRGPTSPGNGAPLCGRHNREKENGYTVRRDERGRIRIYRPDGTFLEDWC